MDNLVAQASLHVNNNDKSINDSQSGEIDRPNLVAQASLHVNQNNDVDINIINDSQSGMIDRPNRNETKQARMPVLPNGNETKQAGMPVLPNDNDSTAEEREIDMLVYKLYDLTDEEIKIIEGN